MLNEITGTAVIGSDGDKYQTHEIIRKFIHNLSYQENREHAQSLYRAIQVYFYPEENATILLDQEDLLERFYYQFVSNPSAAYYSWKHHLQQRLKKWRFMPRLP